MQMPSFFAPFLGTPRTTRDLFGQIAPLRFGRPALKLEKVLVDRHNRQILLIRMGDELAVLKRVTSAGAPEVIRGLQAELDIMAPVMTGHYRIPRVLEADPDLSYAILSHAPGRPFDEAVRDLTAVGRAQHVAAAGRWLAYYIRPRQRTSAFRADFWRKIATMTDPVDVEPQDRPRLRALFERMDRIKAHHPIEKRQAAVHGDFRPANLLVDGRTLYGVGITGTIWQSPARDAARFLIRLQMHAPLGTNGGAITAEDRAAFLSSGVLTDEEQRLTLPFFLAELMCPLLKDPLGRVGRRALVRRMVDAELDSPL